MKEAFIYIGLPGTGTERIHSLLRTQETHLASQGCLCPVAGRAAASLLHQNLMFEFLGDARFDPRRGGVAEFIEELRQSQAPKIVICSTLLLSLIRRPGGIDPLRRLLHDNGYSITWLTHLRPYDEWLESMYVASLLKNINGERFEDWQSKNRNPAIANLGNYLSLLFKSGDAVIIRSYPLHAEHLAEDFMHQLGISLPVSEDDAPPVAPDPTPQILHVELCRKVAEFSALHHDDEGARRLHARMRHVIPDLPQSPPYRCLELRLSQQIRSETRDSYGQVLRAAGIIDDYDAFFPARLEYGTSDIRDVPLTIHERADFHKALLYCILA